MTLSPQETSPGFFRAPSLFSLSESTPKQTRQYQAQLNTLEQSMLENANKQNVNYWIRLAIRQYFLARKLAPNQQRVLDAEITKSYFEAYLAIPDQLPIEKIFEDTEYKQSGGKHNKETQYQNIASVIVRNTAAAMWRAIGL